MHAGFFLNIDKHGGRSRITVEGFSLVASSLGNIE